MSDLNENTENIKALFEGHQPLQKGHTPTKITITKPPSGGSGVAQNSNTTTTNTNNSSTNTNNNTTNDSKK